MKMTLVFSIFLISFQSMAGTSFCPLIFGKSAENKILEIQRLSIRYAQEGPSKKQLTGTALLVDLIQSTNSRRQQDWDSYLHLLQNGKRLKKIEAYLSKIENAPIKQGKKQISEFDVSRLAFYLRPFQKEPVDFLKGFFDYNMTKEVEGLLVSRAEQMILHEKLLRYFNHRSYHIKKDLNQVYKQRLLNLKPLLKALVAVPINVINFHLGSFWFGIDTFIPSYLPSLDLVEQKKLSKKALRIYKKEGGEALTAFFKKQHPYLFQVQKLGQLPLRYPQILIKSVLFYVVGSIAFDFVIYDIPEYITDYQVNKTLETYNAIFEKNLEYHNYAFRPEQIDTIVEIHQLEINGYYESFQRSFIEQFGREPSLSNPLDLAQWNTYASELSQTTFKNVAFEAFSRELLQTTGEVADITNLEHLQAFDRYLNESSFWRNF